LTCQWPAQPGYLPSLWRPDHTDDHAAGALIVLWSNFKSFPKNASGQPHLACYCPYRDLITQMILLQVRAAARCYHELHAELLHHVLHCIVMGNHVLHCIVTGNHVLHCIVTGNHVLHCIVTGNHVLHCIVTGNHVLHCIVTGNHVLHCIVTGNHVLHCIVTGNQTLRPEHAGDSAAGACCCEICNFLGAP
jgi:hypothetical protein